jgi:hypothetical protein
MKTIYTFNSKVLKNSVSAKWLAKKEAPTGFVMNASNATISDGKANWEGPNYPEYCDLGGKTAQIIISEDISVASLVIYYSKDMSSSASPEACRLYGNSNNVIAAGTYSITVNNNQATAAQGAYGKYLVMFRYGPETTIDSTYLSKIEIRIID